MFFRAMPTHNWRTETWGRSLITVTLSNSKMSAQCNNHQGKTTRIHPRLPLCPWAWKWKRVCCSNGVLMVVDFQENRQDFRYKASRHDSLYREFLQSRLQRINQKSNIQVLTEWIFIYKLNEFSFFRLHHINDGASRSNLHTRATTAGSTSWGLLPMRGVIWGVRLPALSCRLLGLLLCLKGLTSRRFVWGRRVDPVTFWATPSGLEKAVGLFISRAGQPLQLRCLSSQLGGIIAAFLYSLLWTFQKSK